MRTEVKEEIKAEVTKPAEAAKTETTDIEFKKDNNSDKKNNSGIQITVVGKIPLEDKKSKDKKDNKNNKQNNNNNNSAKPVNKPQEKQNIKPQQPQVAKPEVKTAQTQESTNANVAQNQPKEEKPINFIPTQVKKLEGPKILDKIELPTERKPKAKQPVASSGDDNKGFNKDKKKKRKRIGTEGSVANSNNDNSNNKNANNSNNANSNNNNKEYIF